MCMCGEAFIICVRREYVNTQLYKDIQILVLTSPSNAEAGAAARELMACEFFCSKVKILSSTFSLASGSSCPHLSK